MTEQNKNELYSEAFSLLDQIQDILIQVEEKVRKKQLIEAYEQGWLAAAGWAKDYHLETDIGSPAYTKEMNSRLGINNDK